MSSAPAVTKTKSSFLDGEIDVIRRLGPDEVPCHISISPLHIPMPFGLESEVKVAFWKLSPGEASLPGITHHIIDFNVQGDGGGEFRVGGQVHHPTHVASEIRVTPAGVPGVWRWFGNLTGMHLYLDPDYLRQAASQLFHRRRHELKLVLGRQDDRLRHLMLVLYHELLSGSPRGSLFADSVLRCIAIHLLTEYGGLSLSSVGECRMPPWRLRRVLDYIEERLEHDIDLASLADVAGMSPFHFSRRFRQTKGISPHAYLRERRIERAKDLLARSRVPLADIALQVGFCNQAYFTTVFKCLTGTTPARYRSETGDMREIRDYSQAIVKESS